MYRRYLKERIYVELYVPEGDYQGRFRSRIEEVKGDFVTVSAPMEGGQLIPLREGTSLFLVLWEEAAAYEIEAKVLIRQAEPLPVFVLKLSDNYRRVQRRNYVRVPAFYDLIYRVIERSGLGKSKRVTMLDLSGGGMRFKTQEKLERNAILFADLMLPGAEIKVQAIVRRVFMTEEKGIYSVSVEFVDLQERDRDRIIRCVFDIQREMLKKGLV